MKHLVFYLTVMILSALLIVVIVNNQEKPSPKVITVSKSYAYHYDLNQSIEIPIYINLDNHPLASMDSYGLVYIANQDASKKLELNLTKILKGHQESYLNEDYTLYTLFFDMPSLNQLFQIESCSMHITLINDESYAFEIGTFSLQHIPDSMENLSWTSLSGVKAENSFLSRLSQITVSFDQLDQPIEDVTICPYIDLSFQIVDQQLIIDIPADDYLLDNVPIIITYANQDQQVIANFRYIIDYHILKESGMLLHLYAIN